MAKLLLLAAVVAGVVLLLKNYQRSLARQARPEDESGEIRGQSSAEDMVRCAHCNVHMPKGESFLSRGRYFCSDQHRLLGARGESSRDSR
ncbi:MAG: PP0621 family protein [Betaproteobacteria bacterium]